MELTYLSKIYDVGNLKVMMFWWVSLIFLNAAFFLTWSLNLNYLFASPIKGLELFKRLAHEEIGNSHKRWRCNSYKRDASMERRIPLRVYSNQTDCNVLASPWNMEVGAAKNGRIHQPYNHLCGGGKGNKLKTRCCGCGVISRRNMLELGREICSWA